MKRLFGGVWRRSRSLRTLFSATAVIAALLAPCSARAADIAFSGAINTNWDTAGNWTGGALPGAADNAMINDGKTADINASLTNGTVTGVYIGASTPTPTATAGNGTVTQEAQSLTATTAVLVGGAAGRTGTYTISGGTLSSPSIIFGDAGTGNLNMSGTANVSSINDIKFGNQAGSTGNFTISGGTIITDASGNLANPNRQLIIGESGTGVGTQSGGQVITQRLRIGHNAGAVGTYTMSAGSLFIERNLSVGTSSGDVAGTGTYIQTGGTFINQDDVVAGDNPNGIGTINVSGGIMIQRGKHPTESGNLISAYDPGTTGNITLSGTAQVETVAATSLRATSSTGLSRLTGNDLDGSFQMGMDSGDASHVNASGTITASNPVRNISGNIVVGLEGDGVFNHNAGLTRVGLNADPTFTTDFQGNALAFTFRGTGDEGGDVVIATNTGSHGTFNLTGGTLDVRYGGIYGGVGAAEGNGHFNWTGGDLRMQVYNDTTVAGLSGALGLQLKQGGTTGGGSTLYVDKNDTAVLAAYRMQGGTANIVVDNGHTLTIVTDSSAVVGGSDAENTGFQIGVGPDNNHTLTIKNNSVVNAESLDMMRNDPLGGGGTASGGTATLNISDTSQLNLVANSNVKWFRIGVEGNGVATVNQTGGTISTDSDTFVGDRGGHGIYNMSGGTFTTGGGDFSVGVDGTGVMTMSGSALLSNPSGTIYVGRHTSGAGTFTWTPGAGGGIVTGQIEASDDGNGIFTQNGGLMAIAANLALATGHTGSGVYNMNGGTNVIGLIDAGGGTNPVGSIAVGYEGSAVMNQIAGTNNLGSGSVTIQGTTYTGFASAHASEFVPQFLGDGGSANNATDNNFVVGTLENSAGTFNQSGGNNNIGGNIIIGFAGASGGFPASQGVFNQSGGVNVVGLGTAGGNPGGDVVLAVAAGTKGVYNLKGGTLDVTRGGGLITIGAGKASGGAAAFNWTGGTLKVNSFDDPTLINALTANPNAWLAFNLGGLTQDNTDASSLLDSSSNNTRIYHAWTLKGTNAANTSNATVGAGKSITVNSPITVTGAGSHTISGAGRLIASGAGSSLTVGTAGTPSNLTIGGTVLTNIAGPVTVNTGSTMTLAQNGAPTFSQVSSPNGYIGSNKHLISTAVSVPGTGKLDLANNTMVVNYGGGANPLAAITALITSGANVVGGIAHWDGPGITSSTAHGDFVANPSTALTAIGVLDNGDATVNPGYISITDGGDFSTAAVGAGSSSLPANSVLIKYTYLGDSQLAGKVQFSDFLVWKAAFTANLAGGHVGGWAHAQFDYSEAQTTFADFLIWKNSFTKTLAGLLPQLHGTSVSGLGTATAVPEPSSLVLLAIGGVAALWIRRRRGVK